MKLWELRFRRFYQKDNEDEGIICYLVAESSEQIYEFLKTEPAMPCGTEESRSIYIQWPNNDNDERRQRLIKCCGEMYDEETEPNEWDLCYGVTKYGWNCVCEDFREAEIDILKLYGIIVVNCNIEGIKENI